MHSDYVLHSENVNKFADWSKTKFPLVTPNCMHTDKTGFVIYCLIGGWVPSKGISQMQAEMDIESPKIFLTKSKRLSKAIMRL